MIRKSFVATGSSWTRSGAGAVAGSIASGQPSSDAIASASGSRVGVAMVMTSLPSDDEAVDRSVGCLLDQFVPGGATPGRDVLDRASVGRDEFDGGARRKPLTRLRGLDDRHRTGQAASVDDLGDLEDWHGRL